MKAVMFTAKHMSQERVRFEKAIAASTLAVKEVYVSCCVWQGDDLVFEGGQTFYQNLYFWICGYGDGLAVLGTLGAPKAAPDYHWTEE